MFADEFLKRKWKWRNNLRLYHMTQHKICHVDNYLSNKTIVFVEEKIMLLYTCHEPYLESDQNTVGQFLFDKEIIEEKKELLFTIWQIRQHEMKRIQIK